MRHTVQLNKYHVMLIKLMCVRVYNNTRIVIISFVGMHAFECIYVYL